MDDGPPVLEHIRSKGGRLLERWTVTMARYTKMIPDDLQGEWVTLHEAASLLAVSRQQVNKMVKSKQLIAMEYIGGRRFINRASIKKLVLSYAAAPQISQRSTKQTEARARPQQATRLFPGAQSAEIRESRARPAQG